MDRRASSRTTKASLMLLLIASIGLPSCKTADPSSAGLKDATTVGSSSNQLLIEQLEQNKTDLSTVPVILLSEVWNEIGAMPNGSQLQLKVLTGLLKAALPQLQGADIAQVLSDSFNIPAVQAQAILASVPAGGTDAAALAIAVKIKSTVDNDPTTLDQFPTIRLSQMPLVQKGLFSRGQISQNPPSPRAFRVNTGNDPIDLKASGCAAPQASITPFLPDANIDKRWFPITQQIDECFHENSTALARAINELSNLVAGETPTLNVKFDADGDGAAARTTSVRSYEELLQLFAQAGFQTEMYTSRQVADFLGLYFKSASGVKTVRTSVFFGAEINGKLVRVPSEHSEVELLIYKNGKRFAQVRYYLGVPKEGFDNTPSYWRPHFEVDSLWARSEHEWVHSVPAAELVNSVKPLLYGAAKSMLAYQVIQDRFGLPANAYGVFICSDSVIAAVAGAQTLSRGAISSPRGTGAFPVLRMGKIQVPNSNQEVNVEEIMTKVAGLDLRTLQTVYPTDIVLQNDPARLKQRLQQAFPSSVDARFAYFKDFVSQLNTSVR